MSVLPPISPFLWFHGQAEEAARFYVRLLPGSRIREIRRLPDARGGPQGPVLLVTFTLRGQPFVAMNGGPQFTFTPAVSFVLWCRTQREIDRLWRALGTHGQPMDCGWIRDRFGVTWQVLPTALPQLVAHPAGMQAMQRMGKIDIAGLQAAVRSAGRAPGPARARARTRARR